MFVFSLPPLNVIHTVASHAAPGMPPQYWWVTASVLGILALTATIDAFTEMIPDMLILLGLCAVTGTQGLFDSWDVAFFHLRQAVVVGFAIWAVNFAWYHYFKYDALGMGDAKWTMLSVACFGLMPSGFAWGLGSILASVYILVARLAHYKVTKVTFGPFLLVGLSVGLYWIRFANE